MFNPDAVWIAFFIAVLLYLLVSFFKPRPLIRKKKRQLLIPFYNMIYTDQKEEKRKDGVSYSTILYAPKYNLQGKPDYIFQRGSRYIPVEIKSGLIKEEAYPHEGDLMQLAAYFLIIEEVYGHRPKQGRILYKDAMFLVKNTKVLRKQVLHQMDRMRRMLETGEEFAEPGYVKCRYCVCRGTVCEYAYGQE